MKVELEEEMFNDRVFCKTMNKFTATSATQRTFV